MSDDERGAVIGGPSGEMDAGLVANPEVPPAPEPPPVTAPEDVSSGAIASPASPWARPPAVTVPSWDVSGYAPPPAVRLDEYEPSPFPSAGAYPAPPPIAAGIGARAPALVTAGPAKASEPPVNRFKRVQLRTSLTILLFLAGLAAGVAGLRAVMPAHTGTLDSFPTLDRTAVEPIQADAVAKELVQNDVHGLAQLLDADTLSEIQTQLKPLVTFESVTFVGATSHDKDTLAGYVVRGRDQDGTLGLVGLVIRLRDGQVVAQ